MAEDLFYCENLRYLLVTLKDGTTREDMEGIAPDFRTLESVCTVETVFAVIVTARGQTICPSGTAHPIAHGLVQGTCSVVLLAIRG
jgi:hypothetical protein